MDAVEEIKQRLAIEDVLSEYVELKRAGRNFKALSPFSNEKTPSLMISPEKQIWHDFSSGKGGNMFGFVMEIEGLDFRGALELLARKAGLDLSQYQKTNNGNSKLKARLTEAHELASKFYQVQFSKNQGALEYVFKKRGLDKTTALAFRIGYAPNTGYALTDFLLSKGFTVDELQRGGLSTQRGRRPSDMFRGRIMIPLMDQTGSVIGFTGRLLADVPNAPKYLNTPQSLLYDKSRHVFGLHLAKDTIRKRKYAVVVEGNMDVVASHQAGVTNVVATAGTAITEMHLKTLARFVPDIRLAFDQDNAGLAAAERAIPLASKTGVSLSMVTVVGAKDPDELIQKDPAAWAHAIEQPSYALDWLVTQYQHKLDLTSAQGKREFSDIVLAVVRNLTDPVEQEHYLEKLGGILGVSKDALARKLSATPVRAVPKKQLKTHAAVPSVAPPLRSLIEQQNALLALCFFYPAARSMLDPVMPEMMPEPDAQTLTTFLQRHGTDEEVKAHGDQLRPIADYVKILELVHEERYQGFDTPALLDIAYKLRARLIDEYTRKQQTVLNLAYQQVGTDEQKRQVIRDKLTRIKELRSKFT